MRVNRRTIHRSALQTAAWMAFVSLLFAAFDPLGVDSVGDRRSAQAFDRMWALTYPERPGRDLITTVSIDEAALAAVGREWPPQYDFYSEVIETLTADPKTRPAAIFLDFTFMSELYSSPKRDSFIEAVAKATKAGLWTDSQDCHESPLAKLKCIHDNGGTPVIIGKPYPVDRCDTPLTLVLLDQVAVLTPLGWPGLRDSWIPAIPRADYDEALKDRPAHCPAVMGQPRSALYQPEPEEADTPPRPINLDVRGVQRYDLTPSTALLTAICLQSSASRACSLQPGTVEFLRANKPYVVFWGSIPDPNYLALDAELYQAGPDADRRARCREERKGDLGRLLKVGGSQLFADLSQDGAALGVECPYHADFRYEVLAAETGLIDEKVRRRIFENFISGRAVLVGSALAQSNDWVSSTTRIRAPGVSLHAMALDNLLTWGDGMHRNPGPLIWSLDQGEAVEAITSFAMGYGVTWLDPLAPVGLSGRGPKARRPRWRRLGVAAGAIAGSLIIFVLLTAALVLGLRWTPVNFTGLWALTVVLSFLRFRDSLVQAPADIWAAIKTRRRRLRRLIRKRFDRPGKTPEA